MANTGDIESNITLSGGQSVRRNVGDTDFEAFATPVLNGKAEQYYGGDGAFHDIPTVASAFLDDTASDITGYKTLTTILPTGSIANVAASITGAGTLIKAFALAAGVFDFISGQVLHLHIHAAKTAGTKTAVLYLEIYHRTSGGTETLLGTSDATANLPGSNTEFDLSVSVPDTAFSITDRFVAKYLSTPSGAGTDPTVTIYYQGNTNARVEIGTNLTTAGATDANAVHVNVAGEIAAITAKASPVSGDYLLIEDSADANNKKSVTIGDLPTGADANAIHDNVAGEIAAITAKATPVSGDYLIIEDSADSNNKKSITIGDLPTGSGTPSGTVEAETSYGISSGAGASTDYSRGDHTHGSPSLSTNTPAAETVGASGAAGSGTVPSKDDHVHSMPGDFVASGASHAAGFVPDPGVTGGTTKFLREDASWEVPSGSGAPTTSEYVTTASDAGLSAEVVIPGLAGSADILGAAGAGTSEEYDTATTGLTWNNTPTTVDSNTTVKSHLYVLAQADTTERIGTKAWSPAGALDARAKVNGALNFSAAPVGTIGLIICNSDKSNRALLVYVCHTSAYYIQAYTYAPSAYTQRGATWVVGRGPIYLRIARDGSNNWSFYWSGDGSIWQFIATQALTFTVSDIGFRFLGTAGGTHQGIVDWLRTDV